MKYRARTPVMVRLVCAQCGLSFEADERAAKAAREAAYHANRDDVWARNNIEPVCDACEVKS